MAKKKDDQKASKDDNKASSKSESASNTKSPNISKTKKNPFEKLAGGDYGYSAQFLYSMEADFKMLSDFDSYDEILDTFNSKLEEYCQEKKCSKQQLSPKHQKKLAFDSPSNMQTTENKYEKLAQKFKTPMESKTRQLFGFSSKSTATMPSKIPSMRLDFNDENRNNNGSDKKQEESDQPIELNKTNRKRSAVIAEISIVNDTENESPTKTNEVDDDNDVGKTEKKIGKKTKSAKKLKKKASSKKEKKAKKTESDEEGGILSVDAAETKDQDKPTNPHKKPKLAIPHIIEANDQPKASKKSSEESDKTIKEDNQANLINNAKTPSKSKKDKKSKKGSKKDKIEASETPKTVERPSNKHPRQRSSILLKSTSKTPHMNRLSRQIIQSTIKKTIKAKPLTRRAAAAAAAIGKSLAITNQSIVETKNNKPSINTAIALTKKLTQDSILQSAQKMNPVVEIRPSICSIPKISATPSAKHRFISNLQNTTVKVVKSFKSAIDERKERLSKSKGTEKRKSATKIKMFAKEVLTKKKSTSDGISESNDKAVTKISDSNEKKEIIQKKSNETTSSISSSITNNKIETRSSSGKAKKTNAKPIDLITISDEEFQDAEMNEAPKTPPPSTSQLKTITNQPLSETAMPTNNCHIDLPKASNSRRSEQIRISDALKANVNSPKEKELIREIISNSIKPTCLLSKLPTKIVKDGETVRVEQLNTISQDQQTIFQSVISSKEYTFISSQYKSRTLAPQTVSMSSMKNTPMKSTIYQSLTNLNRISTYKNTERMTPQKQMRTEIDERKKQELLAKEAKERERLQDLQRQKQEKAEQAKKQREEKLKSVAEFNKKQKEEQQAKAKEAEKKRLEEAAAEKAKREKANNMSILNSKSVAPSTIVSNQTVTVLASAHKKPPPPTVGINLYKSTKQAYLQQEQKMEKSANTKPNVPDIMISDDEDDIYDDENVDPKQKNLKKKGNPNNLETTYTLHESPEPTSKMNKNLLNPNKVTHSYDVTPLQPPKLKDYDNYDVSSLKTDDETDDEDEPSKPLPEWAKEPLLSKKTQTQSSMMVNFTRLFRASTHHEINLEEIFKTRRKKFTERSSSANWSSPPVWRTQGLNGEESFWKFHKNF